MYCDLRDRADAADHRRARPRAARHGLAEEGLAVGDGEQVGAQPVDLGEQPSLGGCGEAEDGHDGGDADGDAQRGQAGPQRAGAQPDAAIRTRSEGRSR